VFAASSLGGAAREQYAAMEAGGGAVAAPPIRGSSKTGQQQAVAAENRSGPLGHDFILFLFFSYFFPHKRFFSQKREACAAEGQSLGINFPGPSPLPPALEAGAQQRARETR
jgi:hypothetical protein